MDPMSVTDRPWTVAVLGPGGVGGLLGGLLARAGHRVVFLARAETAAVLERDGLTVRSNRYGRFTVPVEAGTELRDPVDACLVTVKATALEAALERVPPATLEQGLLVPLLNGVGHMAVLRDRYPAEQVVAGTIRVESYRVAAGIVEHASPFVTIAMAGRTAVRPGIDRLAARLGEAGVTVSVADDETTILWNKLAFLAPLALLTTHAGAPVGVVRQKSRERMIAVVGEITSVARAAGGNLAADAVVTALDDLPAEMKSSMLRDAEAGLPLELEAIGGDVVREAARRGIGVPVTAKLVADLNNRYPATK
jgi:2-dehydropantoate 2-reductase